MDFESAWKCLMEKHTFEIETSGGTPFNVQISGDSISYKSEKDQKRSQSKENFREYFRLWFEKGLRRKKDFTNFGEQESESARFRYFSAVFRFIGEEMK